MPGPQRKRRQRPPPPVSDAMLREAVRRHLMRFWPSVQQMRRVLMRRVDKSIAWHGGDREAATALVDQLLDRLVAEGTLDDARFARAWVNDLHRRGVARQAMIARITSKGVSRQVVLDAVTDLDDALPDAELVRGCAYAQRRRLGSARPEDRRPKDRAAARLRREKDLAAMFRAGFSPGVALRVIDAADIDRLLDEADGGTGSTW